MPDQRVETYLAAVAAEIRLPEPWASEVGEELAAHIEDGVEDGLVRGLTPEKAARSVLERLGPPATLARGLRAAHQTPRRLAAGVAGGAMAAVGGAIRGTILGYGLALAVASLAVTAATLAQRTAGLRFDWGGVPSTSWTDTLAASGIATDAFRAGRRATLVRARRSRRSVRAIGRWWAVPGTLLIGAWALFGFEVALSWPAVIALLAIPIAFATGTRVAIDRPGPQVRRRHILLVFAGCEARPGPSSSPWDPRRAPFSRRSGADPTHRSMRCGMPRASTGSAAPAGRGCHRRYERGADRGRCQLEARAHHAGGPGRLVRSAVRGLADDGRRFPRAPR